MIVPFRSGFIAIIGPPNVGKSTFINTVVGEKVSIVTPKPQTTRNRILGIKTLSQGQLIFVDTPGTHRTRKKFNAYLVDVALAVLRECDIIVVMVEAAREQPDTDLEFIKRGVKQSKKPVYLVINKVDLIEKRTLLPLIKAYHDQYGFDEIFPISALTGLGVDQLEESLLNHLPEGPFFYPESMYTDQPERFIAAEMIREKIFLLLRREIPYSVTVEVNEFREDEREVVVIGASIWVEKDSQKAILIGKQGRMLKEIGRKSREEMERFLGKRVYLELWVTVKKNWTVNEAAIRRSLAMYPQ
ncbi:MAG: GTPase Era [Deltaproteobacteria bacterium]|nr:GTPase Era [Deltaproteobacteria bacterium]